MSETMELVPAPKHEPVNAANAALEAWAKANVAARFSLAVQRPRDPDLARERVLKECKRSGFCEVARWTIPNRGTGFSIRFAETALRLWGNVGIDPMLVYEDDERRVLNLTVTDYEANLTYSRSITVPKTVERRFVKEGQVVRGQRLNSDGKVVYIVEATEQDIAQRQGAEVSKAIRAEGLRLIPGDLLDEALEQLRKTSQDRAAKDPDAARKAILDGFAGLGVSAAALKAFVRKDLGQCSPAELADLRELWTAIKEGHTTWSDVTWEGEAAEEGAKAKTAPRGPRAVLEKLRPAAEDPPEPDEADETAPESDPEPPAPVARPQEPRVDPGARQGPSRESAGTGRLPLGVDLDLHKAESEPLFASCSYEQWTRWTASRQALVASAMRAAGTTSPSQFWAFVTRFVGGLGEDEFAAWESMEDLLGGFQAACEAKRAASSEV